MKTETYTATAPLELREAGERLTGVILQEGRIASERLELFIPGALVWPDEGIALRTEHRGLEVGRAIPSRLPNGEIRISVKASPEIREAFGSKRFLSVEFTSLDETRNASGVREIDRAYVDGAAMTSAGRNTLQARAELRSSGQEGKGRYGSNPRNRWPSHCVWSQLKRTSTRTSKPASSPSSPAC